jgi:hypothetical protein
MNAVVDVTMGTGCPTSVDVVMSGGVCDVIGCNIRLAESVVKLNTFQGIFGFMFTSGASAGV